MTTNLERKEGNTEKLYRLEDLIHSKQGRKISVQRLDITDIESEIPVRKSPGQPHLLNRVKNIAQEVDCEGRGLRPSTCGT